MTFFVARYDLRRPHDAAVSRQDLYAAALEQAAYCDTHGFGSLVVSEHHGVDDGYLPSPLVLAAAFSGTTSRIAITVAALLVPLHDPLRLAEDIAVLDHLSKGRVSYVFGLGYRPEEYEMFDRSWHERGRSMRAAIETLLQAWTGEPFEYDGRTVRVTPTPFSRPRPLVFYGGGTEIAARRAAAMELNFYPQVPERALADLYRDECRKRGREPGIVIQPPSGPGTVFCALDPDAFWERHGERLLHDARSYNSWQEGNTSLVHDRSESVEDMRAAGVYAVYTPDELVERCRSREIRLVTTHPLCGGLPPDAAWESLRLMGETVIPALSAGADA